MPYYIIRKLATVGGLFTLIFFTFLLTFPRAQTTYTDSGATLALLEAAVYSVEEVETEDNQEIPAQINEEVNVEPEKEENYLSRAEIAELIYIELELEKYVEAGANELVKDVWAEIDTPQNTGLYLRSGPGLQYGSVDVLDEGSRVQILEEEGEWLRIRQDMLAGWIHSNYAKKEGTVFVSEAINVHNYYEDTLPEPQEVEIVGLTRLGITRGFSDRSFRGEQKMTKQEFAKVLYKSYAIREDGGTIKLQDSKSIDVDNTSIYNGYIGFLQQSKILEDTPTFEPYSPVATSTVMKSVEAMQSALYS